VRMRALAAALPALALAACTSEPLQPALLDTRNEACASCRMAVSESRFASQLVAPGELPRFFDDLGCLASFLEAGQSPASATVFVADHRTREWIRADRAVYTRISAIATPMGSHLIAHASIDSRDQDPAAREGQPVPAASIFGPAGPPIGSRR
jgi:copper chaperone NosL